MGTSGISISCLTFSAPMDSVVYVERIRAPAVIVTGTSADLPQYWVDRRSVKNGIVEFTCYDTLAFADSMYFTEDDFDETVLKSFEEISTEAVLTVIESKLQIGNKLIIDSGGGGSACMFKSSALIGQTVSSALQTIAACACGFWCISNGNILKLIRYDGYNCSDIITTSDYTLPDIGASMDIGGIDASLDSGKHYSYRSSDVAAGYIIDINTGGTLTKSDIDSLGALVCGEEKYTYWSVDKAFMDYVPDLGAKFSYDGKQLVVNSISAEIDCSGVSCSLSANEVSGGEIGQSMGEITRKLENALQSGEVCNNVLITKYQGVQFIEEDDE